MAINVNFNPNVMLSGQVAAQAGAVEAQQRAFQNQMAMAQLNQRQQQINQQSYQFDVNSRLRAAAMRNQQSLANRELAQRDLSQRRGIAANFVSQQMAAQNRSALMRQQFQLNEEQGNIEHAQRLELARLQEEAQNRARDADYNNRKAFLEYQDELTKQRYEDEYTFKQEKQREKFQNQIDFVNRDPSFDDEERAEMIRLLEYQMEGIQPSLVRKQEFPHGLDPMQPSVMHGMLVQSDDEGRLHKVGDVPWNPKPYVDWTGTVTTTKRDGSVITLDKSAYSGDAIAERMAEFMKTPIEEPNIDPETGLPDGTFRSRRPTKEEQKEQLEIELELRQQYIQAQRQAMADQSAGNAAGNQQTINNAAGEPSKMDFSAFEPIGRGLMNFAAVAQWLEENNGKIVTNPNIVSHIGAPSILSRDEYENLPMNTPYYNPRTGVIAIKGSDEEPEQKFGLESDQSMDDKRKRLTDKWMKIEPGYRLPQ